MTDDERAEIKREILGEIQDIFDNSNTLDEVRDRFDERDPAPLSYSDVSDMSEDEINADWKRVSEVMARGPDAAPPAPDDSGEAARRPTGQGLINEHGSADQGLTIDAIKKMSHAEINANWPAVKKAMERGR